MTDQDITKICADAMGLSITPRNIGPDTWGGLQLPNTEGEKIKWYRPLHDDAQAMELMKKFPHDCIETLWDATSVNGMYRREKIPNLNRTICDAVVLIQAKR